MLKNHYSFNTKKRVLDFGRQEESDKAAKLMPPFEYAQKLKVPLSPPVNENEMASTLAMLADNMQLEKKVKAVNPMSIAMLTL